jgi:hypothetical protein
VELQLTAKYVVYSMNFLELIDALEIRKVGTAVARALKDVVQADEK